MVKGGYDCGDGGGSNDDDDDDDNDDDNNNNLVVILNSLFCVFCDFFITLTLIFDVSRFI